ncbi:hypothetical protein KPL71_006348 [Citrus sinensis]|uniref:Uncharacterized protein n=2 Tax=Citrus sinensis TaxID=2711 RepID=A0ACB8LPN8_CITSI|nr:hypothetical protein KPL71_006348 [Citrus sinensis]
MGSIHALQERGKAAGTQLTQGQFALSCCIESLQRSPVLGKNICFVHSHILDLSHFRSHVLSNKTSKRKPKDGLHSEELVVSPMSPELSEGKKRKRKDYSEERSGDAVVTRSKVKTRSGKVENLKKRRVYYKQVYDEGEFEVGDDVYVKMREDASSMKRILRWRSCLKPPLKEVPEGEWVCEFCEARKLGKKIELPNPLEGKKRVRTMRDKLLSSDLWAANIQSMWNEVDGNYWCRVCWYIRIRFLPFVLSSSFSSSPPLRFRLPLFVFLSSFFHPNLEVSGIHAGTVTVNVAAITHIPH